MTSSAAAGSSSTQAALTVNQLAVPRRSTSTNSSARNRFEVGRHRGLRQRQVGRELADAHRPAGGRQRVQDLQAGRVGEAAEPGRLRLGGG
jgi:hypothetical protein